MQPALSEQEIVAKAQAGDEEAVARLYEAHVDAIFAYISFRVDSTVVAEDLTSDVFLHMVRALGTYRAQGVPFKAWLFRIATNLITDYYRQSKKRSTLPLLEHIESNDSDPLDHVAQADEYYRLRIALRALPEDYQQLLLLRFVQELPHAEITGILNKSNLALRSMQYRALKALAEQLEKLTRPPSPEGVSNE